MPFHGTGETLTDRRSRYIHVLTGEVVISNDLFANSNQIFRAHTELDNLALGFNLRNRKLTAISFGQAINLGRTNTKLKAV